jgi:recombinational DNA repair ATPase RecF
MKAAEEALRESPDAAQSRLQFLEREVQRLHPFYREVMPSFTRINDSRKQVLDARQRLLSALNSR